MSEKWQPFCPGEDELMYKSYPVMNISTEPLAQFPLSQSYGHQGAINSLGPGVVISN